LVDTLNKKITYNNFFISTLKLINYLNKRGIKKNSKILILSDNCSNYLILLTACLFGGYVACPVDPTLKSERLEELKKNIQN